MDLPHHLHQAGILNNEDISKSKDFILIWKKNTVANYELTVLRSKKGSSMILYMGGRMCLERGILGLLLKQCILMQGAAGHSLEQRALLHDGLIF